MKTFFLEKSYVIASIFVTKQLYLRENFVTIEECNEISNILQKRYNEKNLNVCIIDNIDPEYFTITDGVITLNKNKNVDVQSIKQRYQGYIPNIDILLVLWDNKFILENIKMLKVS